MRRARDKTVPESLHDDDDLQTDKEIHTQKISDTITVPGRHDNKELVQREPYL